MCKYKIGEFECKNSKILVLNTWKRNNDWGKSKTGFCNVELNLSEFFSNIWRWFIKFLNISKLYKSHKLSHCLTTLTAVRPPAKFGRLELEGNMVASFGEKNQ